MCCMCFSPVLLKEEKPADRLTNGQQAKGEEDAENSYTPVCLTYMHKTAVIATKQLQLTDSLCLQAVAADVSLHNHPYNQRAGPCVTDFPVKNADFTGG